MMDKTTEEEIRELAPRCEHEWACADPDHCFSCSVKHVVGENVLALADVGDCECCYRVEFGGALYCACPARYQRYMQDQT